jgi:L-asparagine oxygenase
MSPNYIFSAFENATLASILESIKANPYTDYAAFHREVDALSRSQLVPAFFRDLCAEIRTDRDSGSSDIHALSNCPIDSFVPLLDLDNPVEDKYRKKTTFVGEGFLLLFSILLETPLLAYGSRNNGDFFTDVIAINRYSGQQTGFSDSELVYHNDRTAHAVRADFITLLGLRCPVDDLVYTGFIDGKKILERLTAGHQAVLRQPYFVTPFDVYSRDTNENQVRSDLHPVLENHHSFRYLDAFTRVVPEAPEEAKDALFAMRDALALAPKTRFRMRTGDLMTFTNQDGLHNRDRIEVHDLEGTRQRWLLKTYAFRNAKAAARHTDKWVAGVPGRVAE